MTLYCARGLMIADETRHICPAVHLAACVRLGKPGASAQWLAKRLKSPVTRCFHLLLWQTHQSDFYTPPRLNGTQTFNCPLCVCLHPLACSAQMGLIETTRGLLPGAGKIEQRSEKLSAECEQRMTERWPWLRFVLQGAVSGCHGWLAWLWPKSSSSQVVPQNRWQCADLSARGSGEGDRSVHHALSVSLPGRRVGGQTALEMGLVNRAVDQNKAGDAAYREALSLAREILPQVWGCSSHPPPPWPALHPCFLPIPPLSSPLLQLCLSSGLCRSVFLLLQFRCLQCLAGCCTTVAYSQTLKLPICVADNQNIYIISLFFFVLMTWNSFFVKAPVAVRMAKEAINRGVEVNQVMHHRFNSASPISDSTPPLLGWYEFCNGDREVVLRLGEMCLVLPQILQLTAGTDISEATAFSSQVIPTRDRREGMAAFMEKRPPRYTGE